MPLGNLTSQFFANVYLNEMDQFVKHKLKAKYYIRYVDDFVILHNSKEQLEKWKEQINNFIKEKLKLELHQQKSHINPLKQGVTFLGFRIFYNHKLIKRNNLRHFEHKFKELKILYRENKIKREKVVEKLEGWIAYSKHADTYKYRRELLRQFNKNFPVRYRSQIIRSKKIRNFYKKVYRSKLEFSVQKTLLLIKKGFTIQQIATTRLLKEGTVWAHFANLIGHGQISVWYILPKTKIVKILQKIKIPSEPLKQIKKRIKEKNITFDEIECVRAHLKFKEKIKAKKPLQQHI